MKKLLFVVAGVMAPLSFVVADDANKADGGKAPVQATGPTFPDWDKRIAGESLDVSGKTAEEKK